MVNRVSGNNSRLQAYQTEMNRKKVQNKEPFDGGDFEKGLQREKEDRETKDPGKEEPGVILEIGKTSEPAEKTPDAKKKDRERSPEAGETQSEASGTSSFAELAKNLWERIRRAVSGFLKELWNGPEKESFPETLEEAQRRQAETETAGETGEEEPVPAETLGGAGAVPGAEKPQEADGTALNAMKASYGDRTEKEDSMEDFLRGTQRAKAAHNTDILTYYDRSGKMVKVQDKGRIIDGK